MVVVCDNRAVAGKVVLLLLRHSLRPYIHFRVDATDDGDPTIAITIIRVPSAERLARLRPALAATLNTRIQ
jgi:hypothetical protein